MRALLENDINLDGRVATAVENLAADDISDGCHEFQSCARFYRIEFEAKRPRFRLAALHSAINNRRRERTMKNTICILLVAAATLATASSASAADAKATLIGNFDN